jgi:2-phospho-L-lactate guanylyltransferase
VADAPGVGTTMYAAPHELFDPHFGPGSRLQHLGAGAVEIDGDLLTLRHDVDDLDDLRRALDLGVGPHTSAAAAAVRTQ